MNRSLQQDCKERTSITTTFNNDDRIPTYTGIMFEIYPNMDLELLTMELDIRVNEAAGQPDLWVEVYTLVGSYELFEAYTADRWTLVTETNAVLLPGGQGAIIPTSDFNKVEMKAGERRSFYVTFRKSYIDFVADALQKSGEVQMTTPELDISVGVGFNEYKFPGDFDRTLDPQFAGVFHLRRSGECSLFVKNTELTFSYLVEAEPTPEISSQLVEAVQEAIKSLMATDSILQSYQKQFGLVQLMEPIGTMDNNSGACPDQWATCPDRYYSINVSFEHNDKLDEGELKYQFYRHYGIVDGAVKAKITDHSSLYVGLASVSADMTMSLIGTPENSIMDSVQADYFKEAVVSFLQARIDPKASIFSLAIDSQSRSKEVRHARGLQGSDLMVTGKLFGGQGLYYSAEDFRSEVEDTFRTGQDIFIESLTTNGLRPSDVSENGGIEIFNGITSVGGFVRVDETPQQSAPGMQGPMTQSANFGMIVGVVLAVAFTCLVVWLVSHFWRLYQQREDKERMREYREERERIDRMNWQKQIDDEYDEVFGGGNDNKEADNEAPLDARRYLESITDTDDDVNSRDLENGRTLKRSSSFHDPRITTQRMLPARSKSCQGIDGDLSQYETTRTGGLYKGVVEPKKGQKPQLPKATLDKFLKDEEGAFIRRGNARSVSSSAISIGSYSAAKPPTRSRSGPVLGCSGPSSGHPTTQNGPVPPRLPPGRSASGPNLFQNQPPRAGPPVRAPPGRARSYNSLPPGVRPPPPPPPPPPGIDPRSQGASSRIPPSRSQSLNQSRPPPSAHPQPHVFQSGPPLCLPSKISDSQSSPCLSDPKPLRSGSAITADVSQQRPENPPMAPQRPQHTPLAMMHKQVATAIPVQQIDSQAVPMPLSRQQNTIANESVTLSRNDSEKSSEVAPQAARDLPPRAETPPVETYVKPANSPNTSTSSMSLEEETEHKKDKKKKEKKEKKSKKEKKEKKEKKAKKEKKKSKESKPNDVQGQQEMAVRSNV